MLNALREKTKGWMGAALLVVLVVPFVLWGVSSYVGGASQIYVARGRGIRISQEQFARALARQRVALEQTFGKNFNPALLTGDTFKRAVLRGLINKTLLINSAVKAGYVVNPDEMAYEIRHIPAFRVGGHFNAARYQEVLEAQGLTVAGFERRVRDLTLLDQVRAGLLASTFVPQQVVAHAARLFGQKRVFDYVVLSPRRFMPTGPVSLQRIQAYYTKHKNAFRLPQEVRIAYVVLSPAAVLRTMTERKVGRAALQRAYQAHIAQFTRPEERLVRHIMIALPPQPSAAAIAAAKARLVALRARIIAHSASFGALARRYSQDPGSAAQGGSLGFVTQADLSKPVGRAAFGLALNTVSAPVVGRSGVHLLEVTAIHPARVVPLAKVRKVVARMVLKRRARRLMYHRSERLRNAAFEHPHNLAAVARKVHLKLQESGWFTRTHGVGVTALPAMVKAVFMPKVLAGRRNTHAIPVGADALVVAHVVARKAARFEPLATARAAAVRALRAASARRRLKAEEALLVQELRKGASLKTLARQMHLVRKTPAAAEAVTPGLAPGLLKAVFRAPVSAAGHPAPGSAHLGAGRRAVFIVHQVLPGVVDPGSSRYIKLEESLIRDSGVETYLAYMKSLRERAHIHINAQAL
ncbi:SurA N-terminal domain-containing protein [Acidiferrobacter sp.]|uniref:SurA N-terminal domain-containing protein n=1 Tax=Acidiferrobacter sp. TaxID=1872107 RepID=UPI002631AE71|nr:SurA N-terminal domain-containing protein [Acidiferrobacter sp.]